MNFEFINEISQTNPALQKTLFYGYLRSLTLAELYNLLKKHALDNPHGIFIFRCIADKSQTESIDHIAEFLLSRLRNSTKHVEQKRFGYYLNALIEKCSFSTQQSIFSFFLDSGKKFLRKYSYNIDLDKLGLFEKAWETVKTNPEEAIFLLKTIAYDYSDSFIQKNFNFLLSLPNLEEYQIRKLFIRYPNLIDKNWRWLRENFPLSFIYIAAVKNYPVSNRDCLKIYFSNKQEANFNYDLLLWCFARMNKWIIIKDILKKYKNPGRISKFEI